MYMRKKEDTCCVFVVQDVSFCSSEPCSKCDYFSSPHRADIALIGLAVMGQNLIMNMNDHGFVVR